jgi:hypothetical protein
VEWKQISRPSTRAPENEIRARRLGIIHDARKPIDLRQLAVLARRMIDREAPFQHGIHEDGEQQR